MKQIIVNAVGEQCPLPVVKATRALRAMQEPGTLEVHVDNEIAVENLKRMAAGNGLPVQVQRTNPAEFVVTMTVNEPRGNEPLEEPAPSCAPVRQDGFVVAVGTDAMGQGSEELGKVLMKGFLFAVTQLPQLPDTILFYNGGARLTVDDSASLEDIRALETRGVKVLTCGTCLNYYGLTERLAVGAVTNMYEIVETLAAAGKVVKP